MSESCPESSPPPGVGAAACRELREALRHRIRVVGDHALRERSPEAHLAALREAGERIDKAAARAVSAGVPFRLRQFLERGSFDKALDWIESQDAQTDEKSAPQVGDASSE